MNHKEEKALIQAIKSLKGAPSAGWPTADAIARMDDRVMNYVRAQSVSCKSTGFFFMFKMSEIRHFAYTLASFIFIIVSAATVVYSSNALPGDTLYGAKLAVEKTQVRFTSNPAARAKIQMELAGNRLKEVRMIKQEGGVPNGRMDDALTRFAKDVNEATDVLKQAGDPVQAKAAASEIVQKAAQYKEELADLGQEEIQPVETDIVIVEGENPPTTQSTEDLVVPLPKKRTRTVGMAAIEQAEQALQNTQESLVNENDVDSKDNN